MSRQPTEMDKLLLENQRLQNRLVAAQIEEIKARSRTYVRPPGRTLDKPRGKTL